MMSAVLRHGLHDADSRGRERRSRGGSGVPVARHRGGWVIGFSSKQAENPPVVVPEMADNRPRAKRPENPIIITLSGKNAS